MYILGPSLDYEKMTARDRGKGCWSAWIIPYILFLYVNKNEGFIASFCFLLNDYIKVFIACTSIASESDKQKQYYKKESNYLWPQLKFFPCAFSSAIILRQANIAKAIYQSRSPSLPHHPTCTPSLISFRSFQEILITKNLGFLDLMPFMVWMIPFGSVLVQKVSTAARLVSLLPEYLFSMSAFFIQDAFPFLSIYWNFTWTLRPSSRYMGSLKALWMASAPGDSFWVLGILCNSTNINCYSLKSQLSLYVYISYPLQPTVPLSGPSLIYLFLVAFIWIPYVKDQLKCLSSHCSDFLHCSQLTYFSFCKI